MLVHCVCWQYYTMFCKGYTRYAIQKRMISTVLILSRLNVYLNFLVLTSYMPSILIDLKIILVYVLFSFVWSHILIVIVMTHSLKTIPATLKSWQARRNNWPKNVIQINSLLFTELFHSMWNFRPVCISLFLVLKYLNSARRLQSKLIFYIYWFCM